MVESTTFIVCSSYGREQRPVKNAFGIWYSYGKIIDLDEVGK